MQGKVGAVLAPLGFGLLAIVLVGTAGANAVTDAAQPSLTLPASATTNATSSLGAVVSFIAVATDDVRPTSLICAPASGTRFVVGATTVACTAVDAASHSTSATFTITVLSAPEQLALLRGALVAMRIAPDVQQGLLDKLDAAKQTIQAGQSKIACNQLNAFANQVRAQTGKAITDATDLLRRQNEIEAALDCVPSKAAPLLLGPRADVTTTTAPGIATATVRYTGPSCDPASPAVIGVGTTTVTCTAANTNGTTKVSFNVAVLDKEAPVLTLPADITVRAPAGSSTAPVDFTVGATDNVPGVSTRCVPASGTNFVFGTTTVNCTATDTSGNTATGAFRVTVNFAISGRITDRDTHLPLAGVRAAVFDTVTGHRVDLTTSGGDGRYSIVVPPGSYTVRFNGNQAVPYLVQKWNGRPDDQPGDVITLSGSVGGIDADLIPGYFIHGQVTDATTHELIGPPGVAVNAVDPALPCCHVISEGSTAADGTYRLVVPKGSTVKLQFRADPSLRYMERWWDGRRNISEADPLTVNAETFGKDVALIPAVLLSGRVTDDRDGGGIGSVAVVITDSTTTCCPFGGITVASTAPDGTYRLLVPKGVPVKIQFVPFGSADPHFMGEWFDDQPSWDAATIRSFTVDTSGINAGLSRGFFISGHVARQDGTPIEGLFANANDGLAGCCHFISGSRTNASGDYRILVRPGTYKVLFFSRAPFLANDGVTYVDQWWNGAPSFEQGTPIVVSTADVGGISAVMARAVVVSGHVTDATRLVPVAGYQVNAVAATGLCCQFVGGAQTDAHGDYSIAVPPGMTVKVDFGVFAPPPPGTRYAPQWWNNKTTFESADPIVAIADAPHTDARLADGFLITGHVTEQGSGAALGGIHVQLTDPAVPCCPFRVVAHTQTNASGDYTLAVAAGSYKVQFFEFPLPAVHPHTGQWWDHKPFDQGADLLVVAADRGAIDAALPLAVFISGHVTNADETAAVVGLNVSAQDASQCCHFVGGGQTDSSGNYRFPVPAGSSVKVEFGVFSGPPPGTAYLGQWWDNKPDFGAATTINASADVSGVNAKLASGFVLSGHVSDATGTIPLAGIGVNANDATVGCCQFIVGTQTDALGNYRLIVPPGRLIRVFFSTDTNAGVRYIPQWYNGQPFFDQADDIAMTQDRGNIDARLALGVLIHGRVTDSTGAIPIVGLNVSAQDARMSCCRFVGGAQTNFDGRYTMVVPSGHDVKIEFGVFNPLPGSHLLGQWYKNKLDFGSADAVPTSSDQNDIDAQLESGFLIRGTVIGPGGPVANVFVSASLGGPGTFCCQGVGGIGTDATGHFQIAVRSGTYRLQANPQPNTHLRQQWWNGVPGGTVYFDRASDIVVASADATDKNFTLVAGTLIQGHVSEAGTTQPIGGIGINADDADAVCCEALAFTGTNPDGNYAVVVPIGAHIRMFFGSGPDRRHIEQWWDNKPFFDNADTIDTTTDQPAIDAHLVRAVVISGHVSNSDGSIPVAGFQVNALEAAGQCCQFIGGAQTDAQGNYKISVPPGRIVKVVFGIFGGPPPGTRYVGQWWNNQSTFETATSIVATADVAGIDARLANGFIVTGHVSEPGGAALAGVHVQVIDPAVPCCPFREIAHTQTNASGDYNLALPAGSYKVQFFEYPLPAHPHMNQWWQNKPFDQGADLLVVVSDRSAIDAVLTQAVFIRGRVTEASGTVGIAGVFVSSPDATLSCCQFVAGSSTDGSGNYSYIVPLGSSVKVQFSPPPGSPYIGQWWDNKRDFTSADPLSMTMDRNGIDARLAITQPPQFTAQSTASNVVTVTYSKPVCRTIPLNPADWTVRNLSAGFVDPVVGDGTPICNVTFSNAVTSARLFLVFPVPAGAVVEVHLNELAPGAGNNPDIRDAAGNLVTAPQVQAAAATAPPTAPPTITSATGAVGATTVTINFSESVFCPTPLFVGQFTLNSGNPAVTDPTFSAFSFTPCAPTQTAASSSFALQTSTPLPANTNYTLTFAPFASNEIENVYHVSVVNPPGIASTIFNTGVPDLAPPTIVDADLTNKVGPFSDFANIGDSFTLTFDKKMFSVAINATIAVQDQAGTTATINCGGAVNGATCIFDTTVTILTVSLTTPLTPSASSTTPGLAIPFNITATTNIRDASGKLPNIPGSSDRLVEYNTEAGG